MTDANLSFETVEEWINYLELPVEQVSSDHARECISWYLSWTVFKQVIYQD